MVLTEAQERALADEVVQRLQAYSFKGLKAIAEEVDMHFNTLYYWKTGRYTPKVEYAQRVLTLLRNWEKQVDNT